MRARRSKALRPLFLCSSALFCTMMPGSLAPPCPAEEGGPFRESLAFPGKKHILQGEKAACASGMCRDCPLIRHILPPQLPARRKCGPFGGGTQAEAEPFRPGSEKHALIPQGTALAPASRPRPGKNMPERTKTRRLPAEEAARGYHEQRNLCPAQRKTAPPHA